MSDEHTRPFACGRCDSCEANRPQECLSPRGGCRCAECRPFDVQQTFTRAEVLAFGERVREACATILKRKRDSDDRRYGSNDPAYNAMTDAAEVVRAVDVARLLEEMSTAGGR